MTKATPAAKKASSRDGTARDSAPRDNAARAGAKTAKAAAPSKPVPATKTKSTAGHRPAPSRPAATKADAATKAPAAKAHPAKAPAKRPAEDDQPREHFLAEQRELLMQERDSYLRQAEELKAAADSLALEHEPGDVQFDEEGGEGGTSNVDRELDLVLSAQARNAINEIDRALAKLEADTYGICEQCGQPIPQARLKALPYAALCVSCKSGGLSRR